MSGVSPRSQWTARWQHEKVGLALLLLQNDQASKLSTGNDLSFGLHALSFGLLGEVNNVANGTQ